MHFLLYARVSHQRIFHSLSRAIFNPLFEFFFSYFFIVSPDEASVSL